MTKESKTYNTFMVVKLNVHINQQSVEGIFELFILQYKVYMQEICGRPCTDKCYCNKILDFPCSSEMF